MMKKGIFAIVAALTVFAMIMTSCDSGSSPSKNNGDDDGNSDIAVIFSGVTADGDAATTTTTLTLTFDKAITGLAAADITLSGVTGVTKGTLGGTAPVYTLPISGFTAGGTLSVAVAKTRYAISGSPKSATIFYYVAPSDLVINNPVLEVKDEGAFAGVATINGDGSVTLGAAGPAGSNNGPASGALMYKFPDEAAGYDYFQVEFELTGNTGTADRDCEIKFLKYDPAANNVEYGAGVPTYMSLVKDESLQKFKLFGAGDSGGFAWMYNGWEWDLSNRSETFTIKITKITFSKAPAKYDITFDINYEGGETIAPVKVWAEEKIGDVGITWPVPAARTGYVFYGWYVDPANTATKVDTTTVPTGNLALKAKWAAAVAATQFTVDFGAATTNLTAVGNGTVTPSGDGKGYTFNHNGGYQGTWVKFTISTPDGVTLGSFTSVTFNVKGNSGDVGYKNFSLLAGAPLPASFGSDPSAVGATYLVTDRPQFNQGTTGADMTLTIDKSKTASMFGEIEVSVYVHCNTSVWEISNVTFVP